MSCLYDQRWYGTHGIGRFAKELGDRITHVALQRDGRPMSPLDPFRRFGEAGRPGQWLLSPGYNAPLQTRMPFILTMHDLNHIDRPDNSSLLKRLYYRLVLRRLCHHARAVLTVSEFSRQRISQWFGLDPERVFNVGNGVSSAFRPDGPRHQVEGGYVLCVSNRRGHKNEEGLLRAFALSQLPPSVKLVLTGEPTDALLALATTQGLGNRLVFSGKVSEEALASLYRGAQFLVFPSFYEGFGLPIIEAFACGTPVITSNLTSMPEIAGDAAVLVNPHDADAIGKAMNHLHHTADLRAVLIERGRQRVAMFSWDGVADRVMAAVKAVDTDPDFPLRWN
jgi:glycosyltransferase involved in cell wall biosynthesis